MTQERKGFQGNLCTFKHLNRQHEPDLTALRLFCYSLLRKEYIFVSAEDGASSVNKGLQMPRARVVWSIVPMLIHLLFCV